jgi:hypothetical protein
VTLRRHLTSGLIKLELDQNLDQLLCFTHLHHTSITLDLHPENAMKSIIAAIVSVLLPFGFASIAWSSEAHIAQVNRSDAEALGTQELEMNTQDGIDAEQLDTLATQINQEVNGDQSDQPGPSVNEFLNLPPGLVIRGTNLGGLVVGGEL